MDFDPLGPAELAEYIIELLHAGTPQSEIIRVLAAHAEHYRKQRDR